jgi:D-alanine-D-alanine ligase
MKVAIIFNKDLTGVINVFGMQNKETYNPKTVRMVSEALENGGHNVAIIDGNMHVMENLQQFMPKVVEGEAMGMVFNMAYGIQGESRYTHIPSMLEMLGIPYVGSGPEGHTLALDKVITKIIMLKNGIPTPIFWVFSSSDQDMSEVTFPSIVKPKMESVSFGLQIVNNVQQLREAVEYIIKEFKQQALVEQFIRGREFAVGLLGNDPIEAFPVLEIDLDNDPDAIQSAEDKRVHPRKKICPAEIPKELADEITSLSINAFKSLQLRDFARVDIRVDQNNNIYLLEINSMASLGRSGSYVHAAGVAGYCYPDLVNKILDVAISRYFANSPLIYQLKLSKQTPLPIRIRSFIRSKQDETEKLLKVMVNLNTYVRNTEGVNKLGEIIRKKLTSMGFRHEIFPQVEVGNIHFFTNSQTEKYDFMIIGNLDNTKKISEQEYYQKTEQKIFGTGIWEHKGGLASLLLALQALRSNKLLSKTKIAIILSTDDSLQGKFVRNVVEEKSQKAKYVIGLHGASLTGGLITSRSGAAVYDCQMILTQNQKSEEVAIVTSAFAKLLNSWINLTNAEKGIVVTTSKVNIISNITEPSAHGEATLSIRFNETELMEEINKAIHSKIPKKISDLVYFQISGGIRRPAMPRNPQVETLWKRIKETADSIDVIIRQEHRWSSSDICFVDKEICRIDGLGPNGTKTTSKSEYILRHSMLEKAALLALIINDLSADS